MKFGVECKNSRKGKNMKRNYSIAILIIFLVGTTSICILPTINDQISYSRLRPQQEKLAQEFGVKIQDYPYEVSFPVGYFDNVLIPGMTVEEVHGLIKGYVKVFRCFNNSAELYYYYSLDEDKGVDFFVFYDKNRSFTELKSIPSTKNSVGSGDPEACKPGMLP